MSLKIEAAKIALATARDEFQRRLVMIDRMLASAVAQDPKNRAAAEELQASYGEGFVRGELPDYGGPSVERVKEEPQPDEPAAPFAVQPDPTEVSASLAAGDETGTPGTQS